MSLPQKLKTLRAEHNMTQAELGRQINVARAQSPDMKQETVSLLMKS